MGWVNLIGIQYMSAAYVWNDSVERAPRVTEAMLTSCQLAEVARRFGNDVIVKPEHNLPRFS